MSEKKLEKLRDQEKAIKARIRKIEAKARAQAKADDTRRKILIGALVMGMMKKDEAFESDIMARLDKYLDKPRDRKLFGFSVPEDRADTDISEEPEAD